MKKQTEKQFFLWKDFRRYCIEMERILLCKGQNKKKDLQYCSNRT